MAVASMVLGIVAVVIAWIPCFSMVALIPAVVGLVLGILALVNAKKNETGKGMAIAGIACSAVALFIIVFYFFIIGAAIRAGVNATTDVLREIDLDYVLQTPRP